MGEALLIVHAAATWAMVGLIWFVQIVHYPLFAMVGEQRFAEYEASHSVRTTIVVMVLMPVELLSGVGLVVERPTGVGVALPVAGLALLGVLWMSTALWQAPLHRRLGVGFDAGLHRELVSSNWLRTAVWSSRGVIVGIMLLEALG